MLTSLITLLGGGLGGLLRFVPEIFKFFNDKGDRAHELEMTKLQLDIDKARATQAIDFVRANSEAELAKVSVEAQGRIADSEMKALAEALKSQSKMTGVAWIDGLNQSVRPIITYWWMALLTVYKGVLVIVATIELFAVLKIANGMATSAPALLAFADKLWTPQDAGILAMILGFWFVDRSLKHQVR